jgi:hypothetical protein
MMIRVPAMKLMQISGKPLRSRKWFKGYMVNVDCVLMDHRRYKREKRRAANSPASQ